MRWGGGGGREGVGGEGSFLYVSSHSATVKLQTQSYETGINTTAAVKSKREPNYMYFAADAPNIFFDFFFFFKA